MKRTIFTLVLIAVGVIFLTCKPTTGVESEEEELALIPKQYNTKAKSFSIEGNTGYSCLVSTLAEKEAEYNYWNKSFWVKVPKSIETESKGQTVLKVFVFGDRRAGSKAGAFKATENVVRVAQCEIPNSEKAFKILEKKFRKFNLNSWISSQRKISTKSKGKSGDWECTGGFVEAFVCTIENGIETCTFKDRICLEWTYIEQEEPDPTPGSGFPSDDPGSCDPYGSEPCMDDGGGPSPPPPPNDEDPCESDDPPPHCECEETGNSELDNKALQVVYEFLWEKQLDDQKEQGGFFYQDQTLGDYRFFELKGDFWVKKRTVTSLEFKIPDGLPDGTVYIHTHATERSLEAYGISRSYNHRASDNDFKAMKQMKEADDNIKYHLILDPEHRILYDLNGTEITREPRCGY